MISRIPDETTQLFERKFSDQDFSRKSGREIADLVCSTTKDFGYGRCKAFTNLVLFPWPHEVEQLREICCGTKALYRFLALNFLRTKYNLSIDSVFLFNQAHASVGFSSKDGEYILDSSVEPVRRFDSAALQLDLEEVVLLVEQIRTQNPLDILKTDQIISRTSTGNIASDFTVKYDGDIVFNVVRYDKPGATSGAWVKLSIESGKSVIRRIDYVCPGDYYKWERFDNEKCIEHDEKSRQVLKIQEPALRCIALDEIYSYLLSNKRQREFDATTIHSKEKIQRIRNLELDKMRSIKKKKYRSQYLSNDRNSQSILFGDCLEIEEIISYSDLFRDDLNNRYDQNILRYAQDDLEMEMINYIDYGSTYKNEVRTMEEIDHSLFVERLRVKPTTFIVSLAKRMLRIPTFTEDDLVRGYFAKLDDSFKALRQEESFSGCVRKITEAYLVRHGRVEDVDYVTHRLLNVLQ